MQLMVVSLAVDLRVTCPSVGDVELEPLLKPPGIRDQGVMLEGTSVSCESVWFGRPVKQG